MAVLGAVEPLEGEMVPRVGAAANEKPLKRKKNKAKHNKTIFLFGLALNLRGTRAPRFSPWHLRGSITCNLLVFQVIYSCYKYITETTKNKWSYGILL
jgi:hypothetical protein